MEKDHGIEINELRKGEILQRSPFLRLFKTKLFDNTQSAFIFLQEMQGLCDEIDSSIDKNWDLLNVYPFFTLGNQFNITNKNVDIFRKILIIKTLILLGYEIGDQDDIKLFQQDIVKNLKKIKFFNENTSAPNLQEYIDSFVFILLDQGVTLKKIVKHNSKEEEIPKPFISVLESLNLEEL